MPNHALLKTTLEFIKTHPDQWNQEVWREPTKCGTSACFAGWAVTLAGGQFGPGAQNVNLDSLTLPADSLATMRDFGIDTIGGMHISEAAEWLLGLVEVCEEDGDRWLDADKADRLFAPGNSLADLERIVAELCGETVTAGV